MNDALLMEGGGSLSDLGDESGGELRGQRALGFHQLLQGGARDIVHEDRNAPGLGGHLPDFY